MPRTEVKPPQLTVVRSGKQWNALTHEIESKVPRLINSNDEHARDLAYLVRLIVNEPPGNERDAIVNKILECAYINSDSFWHSHNEWLNEHAPENPVQVRKRA